MNGDLITLIRYKLTTVSVVIGMLLLLCLCGCSRKLSCKAPAQYGDGIILDVKSCNYKVNKNGSSVFDVAFELKNIGNTELTSIKYELDILDASDAVLFTSKGSFVQNDAPILNNQSVTFSRGFQHIIDGAPNKVQLRITDVTDQSQMPSKHVPKAGEYLYQALDNPYLNDIADNHPVAVKIVIDHMGSLETAIITDADVISEIVSKFIKVKIGELSNEFVTDNYNGLSFTFSDGGTATISLNLKELDLNLNGEYYGYKLDDFDPLWSLMNELADFE